MNHTPATASGSRTTANAAKILLIEDNPFDARLTQEALRDAQGGQFELEWAQRLSQGMARLAQGDISLVLLDLTLPDSRGLVTVAKLRAEFPNVPLLVLTGLQDEAVGMESIKLGAEDYLVKGKYEVDLLVRSIRYSLERHHFHQERMEAQEWKQQLDQLREMDRIKNLFVTKSVRDNPLASTIQPATPKSPTFIDGVLAPETRRIEDLERSVRRLTQLLEETLEFTRVQADGLMLLRHPMDLNVLVRETVDHFHDAARDAGIRLETRLAPSVSVLGDHKRLGHVLGTFVANAIRCTPAGGRVLVETGVESDRATLHVRDGGVGIVPEELTRLFLPVNALPEIAADRAARPLVGLYVARSIVEAHGGAIGYQPATPGTESSFSFSVALATRE